jgi:phage baseplate assembly protein W
VTGFGVFRRDYAFPVRIDGGSQQTAQAPYAAHVAQMIEQVLLTAPGERVDLPQFGCSLEVFAPMSSSLEATLTLQVTQALNQWLGNLISVAHVAVTTSDDDALLEPGTVQVTVTYTLIDTQTTERTAVTLA